MIRNIIKRIIVGVAIALILSFIGNKISNALVIPVNPNHYIIQDFNEATTFTPNGVGYSGVGYLVGNIMVTRQIGTFVSPVWTATLVRNGQYYSCEMGSVASSDNANFGTVIVQTFQCPINLNGSNNIGELFFAISNDPANTGNGVISIGRANVILDENTQLLTEIRNAQLQELQYIIQYLQPIWGRLGGANDYLYGISQKIDTFITQSEENAQEQLESQKVCKVYDKNSIYTDNKLLFANGSENDNNNFGITNYIKVTSNSKIKVVKSSSNSIATCFYNTNKTKISCVLTNTYSVGSYIDIPNDTSYVRFSINKSTDAPQFEICNNGNQAIVNSQDQINDTLNDDSVDSPGSVISDNNNKVATNGVISDLITLPITLFQNILNAITGTCQNFELGTLFNYNLVMPCINLQNILGSTIYTIIDIICSGFFVYFTGRKMIDIFNNLSQLKEGDLLK